MPRAVRYTIDVTMSASASFRFVHLTVASLRRVVEAVRALHPAAFAVFGGDLASPDLLERDRALTAEHDREPTLVFVHHHPWPLGLQWIDGMSLRNGDDLTAILAEHPDVRWIICGHVHLDHAAQRHRPGSFTFTARAPATSEEETRRC
jgi:hypothetical protein